MDFITYLQETLVAVLPAAIAEYESELRAEDISSMEGMVKGMSHSVGNAVLKAWLEAHDEKYPVDERECPHCGSQARYLRRRSGMRMSLLGAWNIGAVTMVVQSADKGTIQWMSS